MLRRYDDTEIQFSLYIHTWPYRAANGSHKRYRIKLCYCYCLRIFDLRWGKLVQWRVITSTEKIQIQTKMQIKIHIKIKIFRWGKLLQWRVITSTKITHAVDAGPDVYDVALVFNINIHFHFSSPSTFTKTNTHLMLMQMCMTPSWYLLSPPSINEQMQKIKNTY